MPVTEFFTYTIKVTLLNVRPPVWRRLSVPCDITLGDLHDVVQVAMGWENCHLHAFSIEGVQYENTSGNGFDPDDSVANEDSTALNTVVTKEGQKFRYEYDFGDDWSHEIKIEKKVFPSTDERTVVCIKGVRACPPEDCGGPHGYAGMLEILKDPKHPEHESVAEWLPEDFNPDDFDLDATNKELARLQV